MKKKRLILVVVLVGLLYLGKLRFRPLNADVWELVSRLEPQPE